MKTASLILLIAGCVLVRGVAYASVTGLAPQQSSTNSATEAGSGHSTNAERASVLSQSRDRKATIASDERAGRHHVSDKIRPHKLPTPSKSNRSKQALHNHEHSKPGNITTTRQQVLPKPSGTTSKVVNFHTLAVRPAAGVSLGGQQFRSGRNRSATPGDVGGPATIRRKNTGAISGTEVNRKHLN